MEKSIHNRVRIELHSFKGLVITNLLGAAFTLAISMAYAAPRILPLLTQGVLDLSQLPYLGIILAGFVIAINWIVISAELMDEHDDIVRDFERIGREDDEAITGVIVRSIAFYRENHRKIQRLGFGSRLVGVLLLLNSVIQMRALFTGNYPFGRWMILGQWFAMVSCLVIGLLGVYIPTVLRRFTDIWDKRLDLAMNVDEKLDRILGYEG